MVFEQAKQKFENQTEATAIKLKLDQGKDVHLEEIRKNFSQAQLEFEAYKSHLTYPLVENDKAEFLKSLKKITGELNEEILLTDEKLKSYKLKFAQETQKLHERFAEAVKYKEEKEYLDLKKEIEPLYRTGQFEEAIKRFDKFKTTLSPFNSLYRKGQFEETVADLNQLADSSGPFNSNRKLSPYKDSNSKLELKILEEIVNFKEQNKLYNELLKKGTIFVGMKGPNYIMGKDNIGNVILGENVYWDFNEVKARKTVLKNWAELLNEVQSKKYQVQRATKINDKGIDDSVNKDINIEQDKKSIEAKQEIASVKILISINNLFNQGRIDKDPSIPPERKKIVKDALTVCFFSFRDYFKKEKDIIEPTELYTKLSFAEKTNLFSQLFSKTQEIINRSDIEDEMKKEKSEGMKSYKMGKLALSENRFIDAYAYLKKASTATDFKNETEEEREESRKISQEIENKLMKSASLGIIDIADRYITASAGSIPDGMVKEGLNITSKIRGLINANKAHNLEDALNQYDASWSKPLPGPKPVSGTAQLLPTEGKLKLDIRGHILKRIFILAQNENDAERSKDLLAQAKFSRESKNYGAAGVLLKEALRQEMADHRRELQKKPKYWQKMDKFRDDIPYFEKLQIAAKTAPKMAMKMMGEAEYNKLSPEEKDNAIKNVTQILLNQQLQAKEEEFIFKDYIETNKDKKPATKEFISMENPFNDWQPWKWSDKTWDSIKQETAINAMMLAVSGGVGNAVRSGVTAGGKALLKQYIVKRGLRRELSEAVKYGAGFLSEIWAFETTNRGLRTVRGEKDLFKLDNYAEGLAHAAALLGVMKVGSHFIAPGLKAITPYKNASPAELTAFQKILQTAVPRAASMAGFEAPLMTGFTAFTNLLSNKPENQSLMEIYLKTLIDLPAIAAGGHLFNKVSGLQKVITKWDLKSKLYGMQNSKNKLERESGERLQDLFNKGKVPVETVMYLSNLKLDSAKIKDLEDFMLDPKNQEYLAAIRAAESQNLKQEKEVLFQALIAKLKAKGFSDEIIGNFLQRQIKAVPTDGILTERRNVPEGTAKGLEPLKAIDQVIKENGLMPVESQLSTFASKDAGEVSLDAINALRARGVNILSPTSFQLDLLKGVDTKLIEPGSIIVDRFGQIGYQLTPEGYAIFKNWIAKNGGNDAVLDRASALGYPSIMFTSPLHCMKVIDKKIRMPTSKTVYHGSQSDSLTSILEHGLDASKGSTLNPGTLQTGVGVAATGDFNLAKSFSSTTAAKMKTMPVIYRFNLDQPIKINGFKLSPRVPPEKIEYSLDGGVTWLKKGQYTFKDVPQGIKAINDFYEKGFKVVKLDETTLKVSKGKTSIEIKVPADIMPQLNVKAETRSVLQYLKDNVVKIREYLSKPRIKQAFEEYVNKWQGDYEKFLKNNPNLAKAMPNELKQLALISGAVIAAATGVNLLLIAPFTFGLLNIRPNNLKVGDKFTIAIELEGSNKMDTALTEIVEINPRNGTLKFYDHKWKIYSTMPIDSYIDLVKAHAGSERNNENRVLQDLAIRLRKIGMTEEAIAIADSNSRYLNNDILDGRRLEISNLDMKRSTVEHLEEKHAELAQKTNMLLEHGYDAKFLLDYSNRAAAKQKTISERIQYADRILNEIKKLNGINYPKQNTKKILETLQDNSVVNFFYQLAIKFNKNIQKMKTAFKEGWESLISRFKGLLSQNEAEKLVEKEAQRIGLDELSSAESNSILNITRIHGSTYLGESLTPEHLRANGLDPRYRIKLPGGKEFYVSKPYQFGDRTAYVVYVESDKGTIARTYYQSNSHAEWAYLPNYSKKGDGSISWYGKSFSEEAIKAPFEVQEVLSKIKENVEIVEAEKINNPGLIFVGTARSIPGINVRNKGPESDTIRQETESNKIELHGQFHAPETEFSDKLPIGPEGPDTSRLVKGYRMHHSDYGDIKVEIYLAKNGESQYMLYKDMNGRLLKFDVKKRPEKMDFRNPADKPDFSRLVKEYTTQNSTYGDVNVEIYQSANGAYQYMFCRDMYNRVWVAAVQFKSKLTSTGLPEFWVKTGDLTTTAYEYADQTGGFGNAKNTISHYVDMFENYTSKIPIIREYMAYKGISYKSAGNIERYHNENLSSFGSNVEITNPKGTIELDLNTFKLQIRSDSRFGFKIVNPLNPENEFKVLRDGEYVIIGRGKHGRFNFSKNVSEEHVHIRREGNKITIVNTSRFGTIVNEL